MKKEHFRKKLEAEKAELEQRMPSVAQKNLAVPDDWEISPVENTRASDPVDRADAITLRENDVAVLNALEARYDLILEALRRIDLGTFGKCEVCGELIAEERLEANPSATTCVVHMR